MKASLKTSLDIILKVVPLNDHSTKVWSICPSSFREKIFKHYPNRVYVKTMSANGSYLVCMSGTLDIILKGDNEGPDFTKNWPNIFPSVYCILESSLWDTIVNLDLRLTSFTYADFWYSCFFTFFKQATKMFKQKTVIWSMFKLKCLK